MTFSYWSGSKGPTVHYIYEENSKKIHHYGRIIAVAMVIALTVGAQVGMRIYDKMNFQTPESVLPALIQPQKASAAAAVASVAPEDTLQSDVEAWINKQNNEWGMTVFPIDGQGESASYRAHTQFELASVYKLFLVQPLAQRIPVSEWGSQKINDRTVAQCVDRMMSVSDNPCAEAIGQKLSWRSVHSSVQQKGYKDTQFNRKDYIAGSAADTAMLLRRLYSGEGYDAQVRESVLAGMIAKKSGEGIRRGCDNCVVYNKTGDFNGVRHDASVVVKDGHAYVLVIFSKGGSWQQITDLTKVIAPHL